MTYTKLQDYKQIVVLRNLNPTIALRLTLQRTTIKSFGELRFLQFF
jgi:hypothetical protein